MRLIIDINEIPRLEAPSALTIGSFDGVHLGHQALFHHLKKKLPPHGILSVLTFSNHPSHLFTPESATPQIYPLLQKIKYLFASGVDIVILIPFTEEFSKIPFDSLLKQLKASLVFSHLAFGAGAAFGKNRQGNEANIKQLTSQLNFNVDYLPKCQFNGVPISSGHIRTLISEANFSAVQNCLGRPYSLIGLITKKNAEYFMPFSGICLPKEGIYPIQMRTYQEMISQQPPQVIWTGQAHIYKDSIRLNGRELPPFSDHEVEIFF